MVAYDPVKKILLPFQTLSHRAKKSVDEKDVEVQVVVLAFDLLLLNGVSYLQKNLAERRAALRSSLKETKGKLEFAVSCDSDDTEIITEFLEESVKAGCEGLVRWVGCATWKLYVIYFFFLGRIKITQVKNPNVTPPPRC